MRGFIVKNQSRKKICYVLAKCSRLIDAHDILRAMNAQHFFQSPYGKTL